MYSIDTNIIIDWWERRYPPDVFPSVRRKFENVVGVKLFAPERVKDEINRVGSPELKLWAHQHGGLFIPHDVALQTEANSISINFPGLIDPNASNDEADRWIIALAKVKGYKVVTHETSAAMKRRPPRSHYIPDVCNALSIPCINLVELMREEHWSF